MDLFYFQGWEILWLKYNPFVFCWFLFLCMCLKKWSLRYPNIHRWWIHIYVALPKPSQYFPAQTIGLRNPPVFSLETLTLLCFWWLIVQISIDSELLSKFTCTTPMLLINLTKACTHWDALRFQVTMLPWVVWKRPCAGKWRLGLGRK